MGSVSYPGGKTTVSLLLPSFLTSLLLFLGMPGHVEWWPLLFVALVPLLSFVSKNSPKSSVLGGLATGFLYHAGMLYWIVIVLGRHGGLPPYLSFPAMLLLSLYMAVYLAVFCMLTGCFLAREKESKNIPGSLLFAVPALWVGLDWLRSILFTGFPWMDLGYGLALQPVFVQVADLGGHHLVTFLILMVNVLILYVAERWRRGFSLFAGKDRLSVIIALVLLLLSSGYSVVRYQQLGRLSSSTPSLSVGVVQGNVAQLDKWVPDQRQLTMEKYLGLSDEIVSDGNTALVVWPETALPFFPKNDPMFSTVRRWARMSNAWLLTGAPYFELDPGLRLSYKNAVKYYNSALLLDPSGTVSGRYEKEHLVPFGEYVPLRKFMPFLEPLVESVGNFSFGRSVQPLVMEGARIGLLICYESIFPDLARRRVNAGADILVNITNDAWYGRSSAPYQSFSMAVLRAVETRRSLVRAANTGISGFVDPAGRILEASPIFATLSLTAQVPILHGKTIFSSCGYLFAPACLVFFVLFLILRRRK